MREDTSPETPLAKTNSDNPEPDQWRAPGMHGANQQGNALFGGLSGGGSARFDWALGTGKVRTLQANGPAATALTIVVFLVIGALIALFFVVAVGVGTAAALGGGAAAAMGLGANALRRRLSSTRHGQLGSGHR
jgi:hypothetical protein